MFRMSETRPAVSRTAIWRPSHRKGRVPAVRVAADENRILFKLVKISRHPTNNIHDSAPVIYYLKCLFL